METKNYSSRPNDSESIIRRNILSEIRKNGKFIYQCRKIEYISTKPNISEVEPTSNNEEYNYHFCGTVTFNFLKKGEEGFVDNTHYTFEGYARVEKDNNITSLSDITCIRKI